MADGLVQALGDWGMVQELRCWGNRQRGAGLQPAGRFRARQVANLPHAVPSVWTMLGTGPLARGTL